MPPLENVARVSSRASFATAASSPLRHVLDVSPVCIRREAPKASPLWRHVTSSTFDVEAYDFDEDKRQADIEAEEEEAHAMQVLRNAGRARTGVKKGARGALKAGTMVGKPDDSKKSKAQNSMAITRCSLQVLERGGPPPMVSHAEGTLVQVEVLRNSRNESGFHIWPDFMTICSVDPSRSELKQMLEGDVVIGVDGVRIACIEDYLRLAKGILAFRVTLLRCHDPGTDISSDPCAHCGNGQFMPAALFCPECGTRRPELLLSALQNC